MDLTVHCNPKDILPSLLFCQKYKNSWIHGNSVPINASAKFFLIICKELELIHLNILYIYIEYFLPIVDLCKHLIFYSKLLLAGTLMAFGESGYQSMVSRKL